MNKKQTILAIASTVLIVGGITWYVFAMNAKNRGLTKQDRQRLKSIQLILNS